MLINLAAFPLFTICKVQSWCYFCTEMFLYGDVTVILEVKRVTVCIILADNFTLKTWFVYCP